MGTNFACTACGCCALDDDTPEDHHKRNMEKKEALVKIEESESYTNTASKQTQSTEYSVTYTQTDDTPMDLANDPNDATNQPQEDHAVQIESNLREIDVDGKLAEALQTESKLATNVEHDAEVAIAANIELTDAETVDMDDVEPVVDEQTAEATPDEPEQEEIAEELNAEIITDPADDVSADHVQASPDDDKADADHVQTADIQEPENENTNDIEAPKREDEPNEEQEPANSVDAAVHIEETPTQEEELQVAVTADDDAKSEEIREEEEEEEPEQPQQQEVTQAVVEEEKSKEEDDSIMDNDDDDDDEEEEQEHISAAELENNMNDILDNYEDEDDDDELPEPEAAEDSPEHSMLIKDDDDHDDHHLQLHLQVLNEVDQEDDNVDEELEEKDTLQLTMDMTDLDPNTLILKRYRSHKEMLDDEKIDQLLDLELQSPAVNTLGNPKEYNLPQDKEAKFHLDRDLRKIKVALKELKESEQRKYAKLCILKHYDVLSAIYTRYCKIGGDIYWLTYEGWFALLRDCGFISPDNANENKFFDIFHETYEYHHRHLHSKKFDKRSKHSAQLSQLYGDQTFHDKDPWTGIWMLEKDKARIQQMELKKSRQQQKEEKAKQAKEKGGRKRSSKFTRLNSSLQKEEYFEKYKLRKIGDLRIIGCMNDREYADIGGTFNTSNYKKAMLEIKFKKRRIKVHNSRRVWHCELIPPQALLDPIKMKVKWEEINQGAARSKEGTLKLYKHDQLEDDDEDIPMSQYVGLSRHEFFDAMLGASRYLNEKDVDIVVNAVNEEAEHSPLVDGVADDEKAEENQMELYQVFHELVAEYLDERIYRNIAELEKYMKNNKIDEKVKQKIKLHQTVLVKLFKKYIVMDNNEEHSTKHAQELDVDEWCAMAMELCDCATVFDPMIWKLGGRPKMEHIEQCWILSKKEQLLSKDEISFVEFQRCLLYFVNECFRYEPGAKYEPIDFDDKLDMVLKWCERLEHQKIRITSKNYTKSDKLKKLKIKRKQSMHNSLHNSMMSNQSSTSIASTPNVGTPKATTPGRLTAHRPEWSVVHSY